MSLHSTSVANDRATTTRHEITVTAIADKIGRNDLTADDQAEVDFWTAALKEHSNRAMLNISRQALAKLLGIVGKLRTEQREPVSQEALGLPPGESPQRNAVCDALTEALLYIGVGCSEACERTTIDLEDRVEVRGLARMMTVRDPEGLDGSLGENTKKLWERIGAALAPSSPVISSASPLNENDRVHLAQIAAAYELAAVYDAGALAKWELLTRLVRLSASAPSPEDPAPDGPKYLTEVTMSESVVRDYNKLREVLGVDATTSFDHCLTLVRQYVYSGKNPPHALKTSLEIDT